MTGRKVRIGIIGCLVALGMAVGLALVVGPAAAHEDPTGCDSTGTSISITVYRADGTTTVAESGGTVSDGEMIKYRVNVSHPGGSACNFESGNVSVTTPDGVNHRVGTDLPLVSEGDPFLSDFADYTVDEDDDTNGDGFLEANTTYFDGFAHQGDGQHPPVSGSTTIFTALEDPNLTVEKTPDGETINAGETASFSIQVNNTGGTTAEDVELNDSLPNATTLDWSVSSETNITGCAVDTNNVLTCGPTDLGANGSFSVSVETATTSDDCQLLDNTATATASNHGDVSDTGDITVECPELTVDKRPDGGVISAGETARFTIAVSNAGPGTAFDVELNDSLPNATTLDWSVSSQTGISSCAVNADNVLTCGPTDLRDGDSFSVTVETATTSDDCGTLDNTATATASNHDDVADTGDVTVECASLTVDKIPDGGSVSAGENARFAIEVTNDGPGTAFDVELDDPLPNGTTLDWSVESQSGISDCSVDADNVLTCGPTDLADGESFSVTVVASTTSDDCGTLDNTATATASNHDDVADTGDITVECASLIVDKRPDGGVISAGETANFTIEVTNDGPGTAFDVELNDSLPNASTLDWSVTSETNITGCAVDANNELTCGPTDLADGDSFSVTVETETTSDDCTTLDNTATATASNHDDVADTGDITVECPSLTVEKTPDGATINASEIASFTIEVANGGPGTAFDVALNDPLPNASTLDWSVSSQTGISDCSVDADNVLTCGPTDLAEGASFSVTVETETTTSDDCGTLDNLATATASNHDDVADTGDITVECASLTVDKTPDGGAIDATETAAFSITVTNNGPGTAFDVELNDSLPNATTLDWSVSSQTGISSCAVDADNVLTCGPIDLADGASFSVTVETATTSDDCGTLDNTATATASNHDDVADTGDITVECPSLTVDKTPDGGTVTAGENASFSITVSNAGPGTAFDVELNDPLPNGTTLDWTVASQTGVSSCSVDANNVLTCGPTDLADGASFSVTVETETTSDDCGPLDNLATATASNHGDVSDTGATTVECPDLTVEKVPDGGTVSAGQNATFAIEVSNAGTATAEGVELSDPLPSGGSLDWDIASTTGDVSPSCSVDDSTDTLSCSAIDLAPGESYTVTVTAETSSDDCGLLENTATASASNHDAVSDTGDTTVECPDLTVDKTPDSGTVSAGETASFSITVSNAGPGTAFDVELDDPLPNGTTLDWTVSSQSGISTCSVNADNVLLCGPTDLADGESFSVTVETETTSDDCQTLNNEATASASNHGDVADTGDVTVQCPDLTVDKTPDGTTIAAGENATFSITVTNNGPGTAFDVELDDPLPNGSTLDWSVASQSGISSCAVDADNVLTCGPTDLADGASFSVTVETETTSDDCTTLDNTATATASNHGDVADTGQVTVECTETICGFTVGFWKTHGPDAKGNNEDVWPYENMTVVDGEVGLFLGDVFYTAEELQDLLDSPTRGDASMILAQQLIAAKLNVANGTDDSPVADNISRADDLLTQANEESNRDELPFNIKKGELAEAMVEESERLDDFNNGLLTPGCTPDVSVDKSPDAQSGGEGDDAFWNVTVTNSADVEVEAEEVRVEDTLPSNFTFNASASSSACGDDDGVVVCELEKLAPGESATVTIAATADDGSCGETYTNTAEAFAKDELEENRDDNTDTALVEVRCPA